MGSCPVRRERADTGVGNNHRWHALYGCIEVGQFVWTAAGVPPGSDKRCFRAANRGSCRSIRITSVRRIPQCAILMRFPITEGR